MACPRYRRKKSRTFGTEGGRERKEREGEEDASFPINLSVGWLQEIIFAFLGNFNSPDAHTKRMAAPPMGRLTEEQRKAVVDSWALVEPDATEHGLKFFQQ